MTTYINIPFPQELYDMIVLRSGGKIDPCNLAVEQVWAFIDRNSDDPIFWTEEGLDLFEREATKEAKIGIPELGYQWKQLFLPNGTELRMTYKSNNHYAQICHEKIIYERGAYSPSQWARKVAGNTERNAWRDIWVRLPGASAWKLAGELRRSNEV